MAEAPGLLRVREQLSCAEDVDPSVLETANEFTGALYRVRRDLPTPVVSVYTGRVSFGWRSFTVFLLTGNRGRVVAWNRDVDNVLDPTLIEEICAANLKPLQ
jgi:hypothetical protein